VSSGIFVWDARDASHEVREITSPTIDLAKAGTNSTGTGRSIPRALVALSNGHLVVGFVSGKLCIVDVNASAVLATLEGHTDMVSALAVLADGRLASGSRDDTVRLWDVDARVCVATLVGHKDRIHLLAMLPGGRLASGSLDGTVRLWDIGSNTCVCVLQEYMHALVVLPGSGRLVGLSTDDKLRVWDTCHDAAGVPTLAVRLNVELEGAGATSLVLLPDGRLATGGPSVRLWQLPLDV